MTPFVQLPSRYHSLIASTPGSVLLQTSGASTGSECSYLFIQPQRTLSASSRLFDDIEEALAGGAYVAGFLAYEFRQEHPVRGGSDKASSGKPLASFGVYSHAFVFDHRTGLFSGPSPEEYLPEQSWLDRQNAIRPKDSHFEIRSPHLDIDQEEFACKVAAIQEYIRAGDTYQVNFTGKLHFDFSGSPASLFSSLIESQPVPYSAFLNLGDKQILSFSPELFFQRKGQRIVTRPMKGTASRGRDLAEDELQSNWLQNDLKNRSENVMIVDLMRNDLGRICEYGSVQVDKLFDIEKYDTLFQMTSGISGTLRTGVGYADIFSSLFPCGSITGAPKLRTMQIIDELESESRGVYTGAIGYFSPHGEAAFNVPIRTVILEKDRGVMGVGSGIVIDSQADEEYREWLLKAEFLTRRQESFQLIESLLWKDCYQRLPLHLERMELSARYFGFAFDRAGIVAALIEKEARFIAGAAVKVRILLDRSGAVSITHTPIEESAVIGKVVLSATRVASGDRFLRHKTTHRELYERELQQANSHGYSEVLFLNERNELTEGAISNIFIEKDGKWYTPPVECGLLPGIYRRHLLESNSAASERVLTLSNLASADAVYLCNAVRGLRRVQLAQASAKI
ncbi:MAG TPA: aminodeoxychorismate synthase component I [Acidobacteriaceae bacterium]|nr:aminodeoxychorismate synthase component I [Acidobacteriaceae bacterium]